MAKIASGKSTIHNVFGKISKPDGSLTSTIYTIKVYNKTFGKEIELASINSDRKGVYSLNYNKISDKINVIIKLLDKKTSAVINETELIINAALKVEANFLVGGNNFVGVSKITKYQTLDSVVSGVNLSTVNDNDVRVLAADEELDEKSVKHLIRASLLVDKYTIDNNIITNETVKKIVFALLQKNNQINFASLLLEDNLVLEKSLKRAFNDNTVVINDLNDLQTTDYKSLIRDFKSIIVDNLANIESAESKAKEVNLFHLLRGISNPKKKLFLNEYIKNKEVDELFWTNLRGITNAKKTKIKYNIDVALLSLYNLKIYNKIKKVTSKSISELALKDINWLQFTKTIRSIKNFPASIVGETLLEKQTNFATYLSEQLEKLETSNTIKVKLAAGKFGNNLKKLYGNNKDKFNLFTQIIDLDTLNYSNISNQEEAKNDVKALQRISSLLPTDKKTQTLQFLWNNNLKSTHDIIKIEKETFLNLAINDANFAINLTNAKQLFTTAQKRHLKIINAYATYNNKLNALPSPISKKLAYQDTPGNADLETLFNSFDYCESEHCSSTLGSAAYLADNLMFLKKINIDPTNTFYSKLTDRRPDIAKINLNCQNTNTLIPYIDVVNEVLEQAVVNNSIVAKYQTSWKPSEINANPEHILSSPYTILKAAKNPLLLPFNYWYEEAKIYLNHLGVNLHDLIDKFPYQTSLQEKKIDFATDYLNLTTQEKNILIATQFSHTDVFDTKLLNKNNQVIVTELLRQSGITYNELLDLLDTNYIGRKKITYIKDCELQKAYLKNFSVENNYSDLDKLLRLKRLQNKLEWTAGDVDRMISYISKNTNKDYQTINFDTDFILKMATIKGIQKEVNTIPQEMLSWWETKINTQVEYSSESENLFQSVFLDNAVVGENIADAPVDSITNKLKLNDTATELKILDTKPNAKINDYVAGIIAGTNIDAETINEILEKEEGFKDIADKDTIGINVENLSKIYKRANFSERLNISVSQYYSVQELMPQPTTSTGTPIIENTPEYTVAFIKFYKTLNRAGFSIEELNYLLNHNKSYIKKSIKTTAFLPIEKDKIDFIDALINKIYTHYQNVNSEIDVFKTLISLEEQSGGATDNVTNKIEEKLENLLVAIVNFNTKNNFQNETWALTDAARKGIINYLNDKAIEDGETIENIINNSGQIFNKTNDTITFITDTNKTKSERFLYVLLEASHAYIFNEIIQEFSVHFNINAEISKDLLFKYIKLNDIYPDTEFKQTPVIHGFIIKKIIDFNVKIDINLADINKIYTKIYKATVFINKFALTKQMLTGINNGIIKHDWLDIFNLPTVKSTVINVENYIRWYNLFKVIEYNNTLFTEETTIFDFFSQPFEDQGTSLISERLEQLSQITGWDNNHLTLLVNKFETIELGANQHFDYDNILWLIKLQEAFQILNSTGVKPQDILSWIKNKDNDVLYANNIKLVVKSKYSHKEWKEIVPDLMNNLREKRRDALTAYLILKGFKGNSFDDTFDLYDYFLLDTEMSSCAKTSRIVLAHSVLQLFMLRVNLNLEKHNNQPFTMPKPFAEEWKWRKKYRVWEANRKVFLYPENWIEPELRDEKSEFFTELEDELKQVDINALTAEDAYRTYLEKLDEVSKLEIAQYYFDEDNKVLYVFARTFEQPHKYFFRTRDAFNEWTPWKKVHLEIESKNMVPIIFKNKLYVFWLVSTLKSDDVSSADLSVNTNDNVVTGSMPKNQLEIKLAYSTFENNKWAAKKVINKSIVKNVTNPGDDNFRLIAYTKPNNPEAIFIYLLPNNLEINDYLIRDIDIADLITELNVFHTFIEDKILYFTNWDGIDPDPDPNPINNYDCEINDPFNEPFYNCIDIDAQKASAVILASYEVSYHKLHTLYLNLLEYSSLFTHLNTSIFDANNTIFNSATGTTSTILIHELNRILIVIEDTLNYNNNIPLIFNGRKSLAHYFKFKPNSETFGSIPKREFFIKNIVDSIHQNDKLIVHNYDTLEFIYQGNTKLYEHNNGNSLVQWDADTVSKKTLLDQYSSTDSIMSKKITLPHQYPFYKSQIPAFLEDDNRVFFIEPVTSLAFKFNGSKSFDNAENKANHQVHALFPIIKNALPTITSEIDFSHTSKYAYGNLNPKKLYGAKLDSKSSLKATTLTKTASEPAIAGYQFYNFYHPYANLFTNQLNKYGIEGLLAPKNPSAELLIHQEISADLFQQKYKPTEIIKHPYPIENIDFDYSGAYSLYNWELFFHAPLMIAQQLSQNKQFEQAQKWFHYIFDPTETEGNAPDRFWRIKPFVAYNNALTINDLLEEINAHNQQAELQLEKWAANPFKPHLIARLRVVAYMKNVLMKYLDNLIAWADSLFKRDSIEYINEAVQIYVLAAKILGRKPVRIKQDGTIQDLAFEDMDDLGPFGNIMVNLEDVLYKQETLSRKSKKAIPNTGQNKLATITPNDLGSLTTVLYFSLPENTKMLAYWNTVADRLFKIRHCLNIDGIERQLALFEPPIDPALLVRAIANGISISDALLDLEVGVPKYRFRYMMQKALEYTNDVKALGQSLLAALEKKDAEQLALLRTSQEETLLNAVTYIKEQGILEATENITALETSKTNVQFRHDFYKNRKKRNKQEKLNLKFLKLSHRFQQTSQVVQQLATVLAAVPQTKVGASGFGGSPVVTIEYGGAQISKLATSASFVLSMIAGEFQHQATVASIKGGYDRRQEEWNFQRDVATKEMQQIDRQIISSQIRLAIAERDLQNHYLQIENSVEAKTFMENKYTNKELYNWMSGEISNLHFNAYEIAYNLAKKVEKTWQFELGNTTSQFIQFDNWDSQREGLLAGEKLQQQLRQMETAYIEQNERENELTKQISLALLSPNALIALKTTGNCTFDIPEFLFDMDFPGHYFRRLKSVSITIPAVTGPYTGVNCKLTLVNNRIRLNNLISTNYAETQDEDDRFAYDHIPKTVATSSGRNDAGMFEVNFNDERYLPFEGKGVIGQWNLELPNEFRQFDYDTINDVILSFNYTAREGGIKTQVVDELTDMVNQLANNTMLSRLINLKAEFSDSLHELLTNPGNGATKGTVIKLSKKHLPYFFKEKTVMVKSAQFVTKISEGSGILTNCKVKLDTKQGLFIHHTSGEWPNEFYITSITGINKVIDNTETDWKLELNNLGGLTANDFEDIFLILEYEVGD